VPALFHCIRALLSHCGRCVRCHVVQLAVAGSSWRRIWPPSSDGSAGEARRVADDWMHQGSGYATDLDEATADFLRFRERSAAARRLIDAAAVNRTATARAAGGGA
jgi:hypothetical protein